MGHLRLPSIVRDGASQRGRTRHLRLPPCHDSRLTANDGNLCGHGFVEGYCGRSGFSLCPLSESYLRPCQQFRGSYVSAVRGDASAAESVSSAKRADLQRSISSGAEHRATPPLVPIAPPLIPCHRLRVAEMRRLLFSRNAPTRPPSRAAVFLIGCVVSRPTDEALAGHT